MTADQAPVDIEALAGLLAQAGGDRDVIKASLHSITSAMTRVAPATRAQLRGLVDDFIADPDDTETVRRLGALLQEARALDH